MIIPCYNEEKNLRRGVLRQVEKYLKRQDYPSEVIVADDGSTDESVKLLEKFAQNHSRFRLLKNEHAGKPFAIKAGVKKARGEIILFADMDQSTPMEEIEKLLPFFDQDIEVVIGSRGKRREGFSLFRQVASGIFRLIRRILLLREIVDTQCGFKAFKREAIKKIFSKLAIFRKGRETKGWRVSAYDVEVLFVAKKLGFRIKEVAVNWQDRDVSASKKRNFIKESKEMFKEVLRVRVNDFLGRYRLG